MHADKGLSFADSLDPTGVDVLVLAGDITSMYRGPKVEAFLERVAAKYPHIVYVMGNHEFYGCHVRAATEMAHNIVDKFSNVHLLDNSMVTINGQRFIGGTGWFPHRTYADKFKDYMNDFNIIVDFEPWVYQKHDELDALLYGELLESDIVVTHHLPSNICIASKYMLSPLNPFFLSEFDDLILEKKPKLWIHGHTHEQIDERLGTTRIVANPLGYPTEVESLNAFQDRFLIET